MSLRLQLKQLIVLIRMRSIDQPIMHIHLQSTDRIIVPIRLRSTDRPIDKLYIQPLSPPDAHTVLLPESDNCRVNMPTTQTDKDYATVPIVNRTIAPIRL